MEQPIPQPICPTLEQAQTELNSAYGYTPNTAAQWDRLDQQVRCLGGTVCSGPSGMFRKRCGNQQAAQSAFELRQNPNDLPTSDES